MQKLFSTNNSFISRNNSILFSKNFQCMVMLLKKYHLIHLAEVDSTNSYASALLSANIIQSPTLITADFQTRGKGQGTNSWESEAGKNLLISLVLYPKNIKADEQFYLSKITSLSIRELISEKTKLSEIKIKWPNDIFSGNEKIAGILIENTIEGNRIKNCIIGAGINVNQTEFESFPLGATSIKCITNSEMSLSQLLNDFIAAFDHWFDFLENGDFSLIDIEYIKYLYGFQKVLTFRKDGDMFDATIVDIEKSGELVLLMDNRTRCRFGYKELEFVIK